MGLFFKDDTLFESGHSDDPDVDDMFSIFKVIFILGFVFIFIKIANNLDAYYYEESIYKEAV